MKDENCRCSDCSSVMESSGGLFWNSTLTECFWKYKCPGCGSEFSHRLTKEEEEESKRRGRARVVACFFCGRRDLALPPDPSYLLNNLKWDNVIIVCNECENKPIPKELRGTVYTLDIKPKNFRDRWNKLCRLLGIK